MQTTKKEGDSALYVILHAALIAVNSACVITPSSRAALIVPRQPDGATPLAHSAFMVCISVKVILLSANAVLIAFRQSSAGVAAAG